MTQLALVIDLNVCVGCHACVTSCKQWNTSGSAGPLVDENPYDADPTGTFFNRVQKDDAFTMFDRIQMDVGQVDIFVGKQGQLEVMCGEQG